MVSSGSNRADRYRAEIGQERSVDIGANIADNRATRLSNPKTMTNAASLFLPAADGTDGGAMVAHAIACIDAFKEAFNRRDMHGIDAHLHFPHGILSGEKLVVGEQPGQLPVSS
jgi:hypothetical protein